MLIETLSELTGVSEVRLRWIQSQASKMYKTYTIPKRSGGVREISQPTPELKSIQRWIVWRIFSNLPVSDAATAYKRGASIKLNAEIHAKTSFTLHLDFESFFPSFSAQAVRVFLKNNTDLSVDDIWFCSSVITKSGNLTIGAPSSPAVTNAMMFDFDNRIKAICKEKDLVYTRYADDLNISSTKYFPMQEIGRAHV